MIVSNIIGGLGNQMFQYAAGRTLSLECGQEFRLDISGFSGYGLHQGFELHRVFNCSAEIATEMDVRKILGWQFSPRVRRVLSHCRFSAFRREGFVVEPHFQYWPEIKNVPSNTYLAGYWQSEKYFSGAASIIRTDFSFKLPISGLNVEFSEKIRSVNAISLHVRRGDYAKNPKTNAMHGLCSLDYYQAAIQYVSDRIEKPIFFVFSDDIAWAKENIRIDSHCEYIDHNSGAESYNDMRLMSMCKHHIIANSSFSWWGAWLNPNPDKIVVAPQRWFANEISVKDLFPLDWINL